MRGFPIRLPTADSLCSLKVARASKISGRKFSAAARRKPDRLYICRNGCAEMQRGGPSVRFLLAALHSVAKRVSHGQAYHPTPSVPVCPKTAPHASAATIRSSAPDCRAIALCPRGWKRSQDSVFWFLLSPGSRALFSQQRQMGTCRARQHAGTVRCRWARLPRVDPLCDRMERGEEEATTGRRDCISAQPFLQMLRPVRFRRATAENFRPEIFEARATLREQSGSTLGRRERQPLRSVPVCYSEIEECPHLRLELQQQVAILLVSRQRGAQRALELRIAFAGDLRAVLRRRSFWCKEIWSEDEVRIARGCALAAQRSTRDGIALAAVAIPCAWRALRACGSSLRSVSPILRRGVQLAIAAGVFRARCALRPAPCRLFSTAASDERRVVGCDEVRDRTTDRWAHLARARCCCTGSGSGCRGNVVCSRPASAGNRAVIIESSDGSSMRVSGSRRRRHAGTAWFRSNYSRRSSTAAISATAAPAAAPYAIDFHGLSCT